MYVIFLKYRDYWFTYWLHLPKFIAAEVGILWDYIYPIALILLKKVLSCYPLCPSDPIGSRIFVNIFICNGLSPVRRQQSPEPILAYRQFDHKNKFHWNLGRNVNIFIQEIAFKIVVCKMSAILVVPRCVEEGSAAWDQKIALPIKILPYAFIFINQYILYWCGLYFVEDSRRRTCVFGQSLQCKWDISHACHIYTYIHKQAQYKWDISLAYFNT